VLQVRKAVIEFIPHSFASVGAMAKQYFKAERRWASRGVCVEGQQHKEGARATLPAMP